MSSGSYYLRLASKSGPVRLPPQEHLLQTSIPLDFRECLKACLHGLACVCVAPTVGLCRLEYFLAGGGSYRFFISFGQLYSLLPGLTGHCLRRAFYCGTLRRCSRDCKIGFGAIFSQPSAIVESHVYIGNNALLGHVHLEQGCLIGSRASILSNGAAHELDDEGTWKAFDARSVRTTRIGRNTWVGEAAVVAADVAENSMISAGAVVSAPVPTRIMVAGNPARFVRQLRIEPPHANGLAKNQSEL